MSKLFYDHILKLEQIEKTINQIPLDHEEKIEIFKIIDGITHYRILHCILTELPQDQHKAFLTRFQQAPFDEEILDFIEDNTQKDIIEELKSELESLNQEIILALSP